MVLSKLSQSARFVLYRFYRDEINFFYDNTNKSHSLRPFRVFSTFKMSKVTYFSFQLNYIINNELIYF